jgi:hypothetical protein
MVEVQSRAASNPHTAYEGSDWPLRPIALTLLGIFLFLVIAPLILLWAYPDAASDVDRRLTSEPPGPRLQTNPPQDFANFQLEEQKKLDTYYWIDRQRGIVHIPIDSAMQRLARDGIDGFPKGSQ